MNHYFAHNKMIQAVAWLLLGYLGIGWVHSTPPESPSSAANSSSPDATPADPEALLRASRATVQSFATQLQAELKQAIADGGLPNAIAVCQTRAPLIANAVSQDSGFLVRRTALKPRNPRGTPDDWERAVMEQFEARRAAGEKPEKLEYTETVTSNGGVLFRYMKAIPTTTPCLGCHGTQLAPEVAPLLDERYPHDQARGFREGDLRGAFSVLQLLR